MTSKFTTSIAKSLWKVDLYTSAPPMKLRAATANEVAAILSKENLRFTRVDSGRYFKDHESQGIKPNDSP